MMPSEGFPAVDRNPFGRKPLEANDFDLLVGRDDVLDELRWYLTKGTDARMLLLTGPSGSGRTSLMRVLKGNVKRAVHVVEVDAQHPAADLMKQLHDGMIGGEPPSGPNQATDML
ncbi:MAG: ATP-binding protein, partial [Candidatus Thermoplasmatota archaeon]|nr:ATP-binding protein [Candidatus Thermoplasmatota archaeon]